MAAEQVVVEIDGAEITDLYADLAWVSVETGGDLTAMFGLELALSQRPDGTWTHLDDERLTLWRRVVISTGLADSGTDPVMAGYVTHVLPVFDADLARCRLQVWGMDALVLLDRQEKLRAWPDQSDADIASAVIAEHGMTADVASTDVVHDERTSTVLQRETDAVLLRRLAARNGFGCWVDGDADGDTVHMRPIEPAPADPPVLAVHFGSETTVTSLAVRVIGLGPGGVSAAQLDRTAKDVRSVLSVHSERQPMGASTAQSLVAPGMASAQAVVAHSPTTGEPEMTALAQAAYERGQWFVTADAVVDSHRYGGVLRPHQTVLVKGAGDTYSGEYEVAAVHHRIGSDGYRQHVQLRRNALGLTGLEDFGASGGGLV